MLLYHSFSLKSQNHWDFTAVGVTIHHLYHFRHNYQYKQHSYTPVTTIHYGHRYSSLSLTLTMATSHRTTTLHLYILILNNHHGILTIEQPPQRSRPFLRLSRSKNANSHHYRQRSVPSAKATRLHIQMMFCGLFQIKVFMRASNRFCEGLNVGVRHLAGQDFVGSTQDLV
ncbi:hypothetical protein L1887_03437 [Cichorium endivia]|nr:hypothetical protein L1887_03437 [Cichorium endivia]